MIDNNCICKLRGIYKAINNFENEMQKVMGLNLNEAMTLCILSDDSVISSGEIADKLSLTRSNTSKVIASLEKDSLIRRRVCSNDNRCQRFHITKKGKEKLEEVKNNVTIPDDLKSFA